MNRGLVAGVLALWVITAGCAQNERVGENVNANVALTVANANSAEQTQPGPDNTEITVREENGVRTETRIFRDPNSRIEKVVVTTDSSGKKTARVYSRAGEVKELPENKIADALSATGDALADAAGFVVDKSKEAAGAVKEGASTAVEKTAEGAKTVGEKAATGAKKVGEKAVEGTKKAGKAVKEAVTP